MEWVVTDQMGMVFNREKAEEAAQIMLKWKEVVLIGKRQRYFGIV